VAMTDKEICEKIINLGGCFRFEILCDFCPLKKDCYNNNGLGSIELAKRWISIKEFENAFKAVSEEWENK
jgi:hypothetical protein